MEMSIPEESFKELEGLMNSLASLGPYSQIYLYGEMTKAGARRFAKTVKASNQFEDDYGDLRRSVRTVSRDTKTEDGILLKGGGAAATMGGKRARQAHLIEWGTRSRTQTKTGRKTGRVRARRPMTIAFETVGPQAVNDAIIAGKKNFAKLAAAARGKGKLNSAARRKIAGF